MNPPITQFLLCAVILSTAAALSGKTASPAQNFVPPDGFVPDRQTALMVAQAMLGPILRQPGRVPLEDLTCSAKANADTWHITCSPENPLTKGGGVYLDISKNDGRVSYFEFYK